MSVYERLNEARLRFHSLPLKKTGHNKFAGYRYFELADFLVPALKIFSDHKLCATITFAEDLATMRIICIEDGSQIVLTTPMADASVKGQLPIQSLGSQHTYIRRYLWTLALELLEHDQIDALTGKAEPVTKPQNSLAGLKKLIAATKTDETKLCQHYKVENLEEMTAEQVDHATQVLGKRKAK